MEDPDSRIATLEQERDRLALELEKAQQANARLRERIASENLLAETLAMCSGRMDKALAASPLPIAQFDASGAVLYVNRGFEDVFGFPRAEIIGKPLTDFVPEHENEAYQGSLDALYAGQTPAPVETERTTSYGMDVSVLLTMAPLRARDGQVIGHTEFLHDVTEERLMQDSLKVIQQRYLALLEASPEAVAVYDLAGAVSYVNPSFEAAFGLLRDEVAGTPIDFIPPEYAQARDDALADILDGTTVHMEMRLSTQKGTRDFQVSMAPFRDAEGHVAGYMEIFTDITARKESEAALGLAKQTAEGKYLVIFENVAEGIYQMDSAEVIVDANPALADILGFDSARSLVEYFAAGGPAPYADPETVHEARRMLREEGCIRDFEVRALRRDGRIIWIKENVLPARDEDGRILYYVGMVADITARKETEEALRLSNQDLSNALGQLEQLDKAKTAFLTSVSHEMRTPLTSIQGFAKVVASQLERAVFPRIDASDSQVSRAVQRIQENMAIINHEAGELGFRIRDVLDYTDMVSGRFELAYVDFAPARLLQQTLEQATAQFQDKSLSVELTMGAMPPTMHADPIRLSKLLGNLLDNAAKFTEGGGATLCAERKGGDLVIVLEDTGPGIPAPLRHFVLDPFSQTGDVLTGKPDGTGLGLPIARFIAEAHGGELTLEASEAGGTRCVLRLPLAPAN